MTVTAKEIRVIPETPFMPPTEGVFMDDAIYRDYVYKARMFEDDQLAQERLESRFDEYRKSCDDSTIPPYLWIISGLMAGLILGSN